MTKQQFNQKINSIENLRHYIDVELSSITAMLWIIIGLLIGNWWGILVIIPAVLNMAISFKYYKAIAEN